MPPAKHSPTPNAPGLARRLARGDHGALDLIVDQHYDRCLAIARSFTGRDDAFCRDATQDAMLRLVRKPPRLADDEHLSRWIGAAVRSACLDRIRSDARRDRRERAHRPTHNPSLEADTLATIRTALAALSEQERQILAHRFGREQALSQIAHDLSATRDSIKSRLARALDKLRLRLNAESHHPIESTCKTNRETDR